MPFFLYVYNIFAHNAATEWDVCVKGGATSVIEIRREILKGRVMGYNPVVGGSVMSGGKYKAEVGPGWRLLRTGA